MASGWRDLRAYVADDDPVTSTPHLVGSVNRAAAWAGSYYHDDPVRHCPECDRPMAQWMVGTDRIDQCDTHGLWFDPGELARVLFTSSQTP